MKTLKNQSGFTLIELLIVVAIVGVLAVVGIPSYRGMVTKSKMSEPKVLLGAVYVAENAFRAEYNSFGNNLSAMGLDASPPANYTYGFMTDQGAELSITPAETTNKNSQLEIDVPKYHTNPKGIFAARNNPPGAGKLDTGAIDAGTFLATATGCIGNVCSALADHDGWSMNQEGTLSHIVRTTVVTP